jgi:4-phytase/acid phosphatase
VRIKISSYLVAASLCLALNPSGITYGQDKSAPTEHLKFALVLSRHGVRAPTWTNERLDEYARDPWPKWDVAPGLLTPHGRQLMTEFGTYYRQSFATRGLLRPDGCADANRLYIYTDSDQRTIETGHGLADGLLPGCRTTIHSLEEGQPDQLFHPADKLAKADSKLAAAALAGRIGGDPLALTSAYLSQLQQMKKLLFDCDDPSCSVAGKKDLLAINATLSPGKSDHLVEMKGPLATAATFAENLQLEYLQGMTGAQFGWGHADEATMRNLMTLHLAGSDIVQRTPYIARVQASNLLSHITSTLQQAVEHHAVPGAIGPPQDKVVFLVGHDTNIANVAALLDLHWLINGYQRDDAVPGGALAFELWQNASGADEIRVSYIAQTPDQMRDATPLSLADPPRTATIFIPACSEVGEGSPCSWSAFRHLLASATDPVFVQ